MSLSCSRDRSHRVILSNTFGSVLPPPEQFWMRWVFRMVRKRRLENQKSTQFFLNQKVWASDHICTTCSASALLSQFSQFESPKKSSTSWGCTYFWLSAAIIIASQDCSMISYNLLAKRMKFSENNVTKRARKDGSGTRDDLSIGHWHIAHPSGFYNTVSAILWIRSRGSYRCVK